MRHALASDAEINCGLLLWHDVTFVTVYVVFISSLRVLWIDHNSAIFQISHAGTLGYPTAVL